MRHMLNLCISRAFHGWREMTQLKKEAMAKCTQVRPGCVTCVCVCACVCVCVRVCVCVCVCVYVLCTCVLGA